MSNNPCSDCPKGRQPHKCKTLTDIAKFQICLDCSCVKKVKAKLQQINLPAKNGFF